MTPTLLRNLQTVLPVELFLSFYGCRGVTEYFNEDGIIFLDDDFDISTLSEDLYYSKMDAIKENFERAIEFPIAEDYLYQTYFS